MEVYVKGRLKKWTKKIQVDDSFNEIISLMKDYQENNGDYDDYADVRDELYEAIVKIIGEKNFNVYLADKSHTLLGECDIYQDENKKVFDEWYN